MTFALKKYEAGASVKVKDVYINSVTALKPLHSQSGFCNLGQNYP